MFMIDSKEGISVYELLGCIEDGFGNDKVEYVKEIIDWK